MSLFRSIRVRLTLWYVLLLAITLGLFCAGVYLALRQSLYKNLDDSLESRAEIVGGLMTEGGRLSTTGVVLPGDPVDGEEFARVYNLSGNLAFDNTSERFPVPEDEAAIQAALSGRTTQRGVDTGRVELRVMTAPIRASGDIIGVAEVGLTTEDVDQPLSILLAIIAIGYPLALLIAAGGGVFLAGRALSPIDKLTRVARKISADDLSQRLDMNLPDDEVGRLAQTFDEMIGRLDAAFRRQRQFTADASHELRTPLTAIKGQTEVALQRERDADSYRQVLHAVNSEVDRMIRLIGSLLTLARADAREIQVHREQVDLGTVVTDAIGQISPAAADKSISVTVHPDSNIRLIADQDLLLQLMLNLLDNSVKYTPSGGAIDVTWRAAGNQAEVEVSDTGPGISAEHLPHIFDRFYRVDQARTRTAGGAGLGLSICRWIAEAHGGSISAESTPGRGSTFTVKLPRA
jgi:heavy metal sensor kinase